MAIKHPEIKLPLVGQDGNAFAILGRAENAMRRAKISLEERNEFEKEATAGDYDHLLNTCMQWFDTYGED